MTEFLVTRDGGTIETGVFDVDPVVDTGNPFGDFCVIKMDDSGGEKFQTYGRGTRVDVAIDPESNTLTVTSGETITTDSGTTDSYTSVLNAGTYENAGTVESTGGTVERFTGYVVERRETEQNGADVLEVEAYSFDQFLRRNTVTNDQRGHTITEALEDIIQTDTPVTFNAANIDVGDDQELTRTYQGEGVETVLRDLAFKSNSENFGVTDELEFFFRPRETVHIDRGIDNTQWFGYDIPELGKEAINEVEVWFDDGDRSVIVDDGPDKLDLQDNLGLPDPGTQRAELQRPLITDIGDAEDIGRKYLTFRNATLSGTVTTFGLFDAEPGDTIDVEIAPRGIDDEFVIAAIEYRWGVDETILTIVEKRGDVDDILSELSESVQRVEMDGADRDAPKDRITTTTAGAVVDVDVDADGNTPDADRFVNDGRRAVRDAWTGDDPPDITTLAVGSDGSGLSRSNGSLRNQTNSASVTQTLPDSTSVRFEATITQSDVQEIGLLAADGTLIARATFDAPVDIDGTVGVTLAVNNDDAESRGVLTTTGQTAVRDVLADNGPAIPTDYAYGGDGAEVAETDTALGNELVEVSLEEILVQRASTTAEWDGLADIGPTDPLAVVNDELSTLQTAQFRLADEPDRNESTTVTGVDGFIDGVHERLLDTTEFVEYDFSFDYRVPEENIGFRFRVDSGGDDGTTFAYFIDGTGNERFSVFDDGFTPDWFGNNDFGTEFNLGDIEPGETITARLEYVSGDRLQIDAVTVFDNRFHDGSDFDNTLDANEQLEDPSLFPDSFETTLEPATTRRNVTEAAATSTWRDGNVDNEQYLELQIGATVARSNNSTTASVSVADDDAESAVTSRINFSNYTTDGSTTPTTGDSGQSISEWQLTANPDAVVSDSISSTLTRGIVPPDTLPDGTTIREAGIKSTGDLLTRHQLADFPVLSGQRVSSSETTRFTGNN